jgi:hypothetical protein
LYVCVPKGGTTLSPGPIVRNRFPPAESQERTLRDVALGLSVLTEMLAAAKRPTPVLREYFNGHLVAETDFASPHSARLMVFLAEPERRRRVMCLLRRCGLEALGWVGLGIEDRG